MTRKFLGAKVDHYLSACDQGVCQRAHSHQYLQCCNETGKDPVSRSTLTILSACRASTRKALQSLDYFVPEGCRALDDLHALTDKLADCGLETNKIHNLQTKLKAGRNYMYLKIDFKVEFLHTFVDRSAISFQRSSSFCIVSIFLAAKPTILRVKQL